MIARSTRVLGLLLLTSLSVKPVFAATPEKIFQDAMNYTVKVRTIVEMPFSEDEEAGAYLGASVLLICTLD